MKARLLVASLAAAPALVVAMATNGYAGSVEGAAAFAGRLTITPGGSGSSSLCFAADCAFPGVTAGAVLAKPVIGMRGTYAYNEACTLAVPYAPVGTGRLDVSFRDAFGSDTPTVHAQWVRAGLVTVFVGDQGYVGGGAAVVAPVPKQATSPTCGSPVDLVVTGAIAFA
ncbi:MAG TPA: hypothetical protein VF519_03020 [Mycobacteriales bacterium]|jgi:hypothetical protein